MTELRIHFKVNGDFRCGQLKGRNHTYDPHLVTCASCKRLLSKEVK